MQQHRKREVTQKGQWVEDSEVKLLGDVSTLMES